MGIGAYQRAGDAVPGQSVRDLPGITDRAQGWAVNAQELVPAGDLIHAIGMIFEPAGVKPGRGSDRSSELDELLSRVAVIDTIDRTDCGEVAVGEIIGAARPKAASQRRERGRARARTQD